MLPRDEHNFLKILFGENLSRSSLFTATSPFSLLLLLLLFKELAPLHMWLLKIEIILTFDVVKLLNIWYLQFSFERSILDVTSSFKLANYMITQYEIYNQFNSNYSIFSNKRRTNDTQIRISTAL